MEEKKGKQRTYHYFVNGASHLGDKMCLHNNYSEQSVYHIHNTGLEMSIRPDELSVETKKTHGANRRNKQIQCMMHSANRHSRSLNSDLSPSITVKGNTSRSVHDMYLQTVQGFDSSFQQKAFSVCD